jgi:lipopolysaccharide transport system permease protein
VGERVLAFDSDHSIDTRRRLAAADLAEAAGLWRLCWSLAWLDIRLRYRGSILGPLWLTLSTGLMVGAMGALYAIILHTPARDYVPYLALSLVLWNFLSVLVTDSCFGYTFAEGMIRTVRMPYSLYAARIVLRNLLVLGHNIVVVLVVDLVLWRWPGPVAVLALPAMALWLADALAVAVLLGVLCARFRDIPPIAASVLQMAFMVSAVIFRPELLGDRQWLLAFNPFFTVLDVLRGPLMGDIPRWDSYLSAVGFSCVLCFAAWALFVRVRGRIAFWV